MTPRENIWIGYCDLCSGPHCVQLQAADAKVERRPNRVSDRDYFKAAYSRKLDDEKRALEAATTLADACEMALRDWFEPHYRTNDVGMAALIREKLKAALRAAGRLDEPQVSAAEPPLKAVEIPAIPDSKG